MRRPWNHSGYFRPDAGGARAFLTSHVMLGTPSIVPEVGSGLLCLPRVHRKSPTMALTVPVCPRVSTPRPFLSLTRSRRASMASRWSYPDGWRFMLGVNMV